MITTYNLARHIFPDDEIIICSGSPNPDYIVKLLGQPVQIVDDDTDVEAAWIVHGGGGVFFDFKKGPSRFYGLNRLIRFFGYGSYRKAYRFFRKWRGRRGIESRYRVGLGIGVSTYTPSSAKFHQDILFLSDFDFLMVRDHESLSHVRELGLKYPLHRGTDIAFLSEYWKPPDVEAKSARGVVGFVLRDWILDNHVYLDTLLCVARELSQQGRVLKFFSLDKRSDSFFIAQFSKEFSVLTWDPDSMTVSSFLEEMSACSVMISSRAHGAIVSACLGIPVVCLGIEPKLAHIAAMLPRGAKLVDPITAQTVLSAIGQVEGNDSLPQYMLQDVRDNHEVMTAALTIFRDFIRQSSRR